MGQIDFDEMKKRKEKLDRIMIVSHTASAPAVLSPVQLKSEG